MKTRLLFSVVTTLTLLAAASAVQAHLVVENFKGRAGYNEFFSLMVPHGCGSKATTEVRMKVPGSVALFSPEQKAGWETEVVMRKLDEPIRRGPLVITEVFDEVIWRGNLPANQLGVFRFKGFQPLELGDFQPAIFLFPAVDRLLADPVAPAEIGDTGARFMLPQDADDLFFAVTALAHERLPSSSGRLSLSLDRNTGSTSGQALILQTQNLHFSFGEPPV